jgi:hypothetical protein
MEIAVRIHRQSAGYKVSHAGLVQGSNDGFETGELHVRAADRWIPSIRPS